MAILEKDRVLLKRLDAYNRGIQDDPYMPDNADSEYRMLAKRAVTNICPFIISTPAQALYVDSFRRGSTSDDYSASGAALGDTKAIRPEWDHWQSSHLDARQHAIYRAALNFGHAFTVTEFNDKNKLITKGLSPLRTSALFDDPANDLVPLFAFHVKKWERRAGDEIEKGEAVVWDGTYKYTVYFDSLLDEEFEITKGVRHGADECPVTRFACMVDLEGRTVGVIEPLIELQNRLNQTVFDLLVVQSFASFKVRTVSGMAPPVKMQAVHEDGEVVGFEPVLDEQGRMIPDEINLNAKRIFWAEDGDVSFGTLDETPLDGFLKAIELAFQHIAALSQTPPHHLLGQIANLSADALTAAETALGRKVEEFKSSFGESWERVFRLAMAMLSEDGADDYAGECIWRDMEQRSLSAAGDALGKLREQLGIPARGLWSRVPGATASEIRQWEQLADEEEPETMLARTLQNATSSAQRPNYRDPERVEAGSAA